MSILKKLPLAYCSCSVASLAALIVLSIFGVAYEFAGGLAALLGILAGIREFLD